MITDVDAIRRIMKHIVWDYDFDPFVLYDVAIGRVEKAGHFTRERVLLRMLERLSWYDLLDLLGIDSLRSILTSELISKIGDSALREKYEYVGTVLQGKAVPVAGWDPASRKRIRDTLLSYRWYGPRKTLVRA